MLDTHGRRFIDPFAKRAAAWLVRRGLRSNHVTLLAFVIGVGAGIAVFSRQPLLAVVLLWLSGALDVLDGDMARQTRPTAFGTLLDIVLDRIVEGAVIIGLAFIHPHAQFSLVVLTVGIVLSMTVFLTVGALARASGIKSFYYQPGLAERTEGFIFLTLMIVLPAWIVPVTIVFIVFEYVTAGQRFWEGYRLLKDVTLPKKNGTL